MIDVTGLRKHEINIEVEVIGKGRKEKEKKVIIDTELKDRIRKLWRQFRFFENLLI